MYNNRKNVLVTASSTTSNPIPPSRDYFTSGPRKPFARPQLCCSAQLDVTLREAADRSAQHGGVQQRAEAYTTNYMVGVGPALCLCTRGMVCGAQLLAGQQGQV